ncbi:MAG TPA: hypothetical protein VMW72_10285 [Sedimentisphaerales bacterium]|nr:hypothetical protein [Sedimentisphaerales bacterium]
MGIGKYRTEDFLVEDFCSILESEKSPWGTLEFVREFPYGRGRTDVVAVDLEGRVLAFEVKLERWTDAMHQAYRNTCFAHLSYVVLPESTINRAQRYVWEFARRCVGMCYVKDSSVVVSLPATWQNPVQPWLSRTAASKVWEKNGDGF